MSNFLVSVGICQQAQPEREGEFETHLMEETARSRERERERGKKEESGCA